jgi:hypothetical protein
MTQEQFTGSEQEWHARFKQEQQAHERTKQELARVQRQLLQERKLWQTKFKSTEKLLILEIQRQIDHPETQDERGYTRIDYEAAAVNIGRSLRMVPFVINSLLDQCDDLPIEITTHDEYDEELHTDTPHLYLKVTGNLIDAAIDSKIINRKPQGGNQYEPRIWRRMEK